MPAVTRVEGTSAAAIAAAVDQVAPKLAMTLAVAQRDVLRELSPIRTGYLKASLKAEPGPSRDVAVVTSDADYWPWALEWGTGLHRTLNPDYNVIVAKNVRYLRFVVGGKVLFRRAVRHPGSRGRKAVSSSADLVRERLASVLAVPLRVVFKLGRAP